MSRSLEKIPHLISFCRTKPKKKVFQHTWSISNYTDTVKFVTSLESSFSEEQPFKLTMTTDIKEGKLRFYATNNTNENVETFCTVYLHTFKKRKQYNSSIKNVPSQGKELIIDLCSKTILDNKSSYLPKDVLTITFKFDLYEMFINNFMSLHTKPTQDAMEKFPDTISNIMIKFKVNQEEILANKDILIARNSYFRAMFGSNLQENQTNEIPVTDVRYFVLQQILTFIQFRVLPDLDASFGLTLEIFVAADKYQVHELRSMCEEHMINHITMRNVVSLLNIALKYNAVLLKQYTKMFIKLHIEDIVYNSDFIKLIENFPEILAVTEDDTLSQYTARYFYNNIEN